MSLSQTLLSSPSSSQQHPEDVDDKPHPALSLIPPTPPTTPSRSTPSTPKGSPHRPLAHLVRSLSHSLARSPPSPRSTTTPLSTPPASPSFPSSFIAEKQKHRKLSDALPLPSTYASSAASLNLAPAHAPPPLLRSASSSTTRAGGPILRITYPVLRMLTLLGFWTAVLVFYRALAGVGYESGQVLFEDFLAEGS